MLKTRMGRKRRASSTRLLPGRTAYAYREISIKLGIWSAVPLIAVLGSAVLAFAGRIDKPVFISLIWLYCAYIFGCLGLVAIPFYLKNNSEIRSGYTTLFTAYQQLEQRDPETGEAIRTAGDFYLPFQTVSALRKRQGSPPAAKDPEHAD